MINNRNKRFINDYELSMLVLFKGSCFTVIPFQLEYVYSLGKIGQLCDLKIVFKLSFDLKITTICTHISRELKQKFSSSKI